MNIVKSVENFFASYSKEDKYLLAFSGGADSLSLLSILSSMGFKDLIALYVNHNLRSRSELDKEITLNKANCTKLNIRLEIVSLEENEVYNYQKKFNLSLEAAARELRYKILDSYNRIVITAHNRNDQVESLMMKLLYGSTLTSLSGIYKSQNNRLRPLLEVSRKEIIEYVSLANLCYSQDSTNSELFCRRNKIRALIKEETKRDDLLLKIALNMQGVVKKYSSYKLKDIKSYYSFNRNDYLSYHPITKDYLLYDLFNKVSSSLLTSKEKIVISNHIEKKKAYNAHYFYITFNKNEVRFYKKLPYFSKRLKEGVLISNYKLVKSNDENALAISLENSIIRMYERGDKILLNSSEKSITKLIAEMKIPYCFVVENQQGIIAIFASIFGGKNRISSLVKDISWKDKNKYLVIAE